MPGPADNLASERAVLGICLFNADALYQAITLLSPQQFLAQSHQVAFAAMVEMADKGHAVDYLTLSNWLAERKRLKEVGGAAYLSDLFDQRAIGGVETHARHIIERARRRDLIKACERTILAVEDESNDTEGCFAIAQDSILAASVDQKVQASHIGGLMPRVMVELEEQAKQKGLVGMSCGLDGVDGSTTGIRPGELWVVGALPGRGKTALAAQCVLANGKAGVETATFSLEMRDLELGKRFLAAEGLVSAGKIRNPGAAYVTGEDRANMNATAKRIAEFPIWVDDSPSLTIHELTARARLYIRRHKVKLLVVDYLRLVQAPGLELRERVGNVANALRVLAKQEKVGVMLLSQLRRPAGGINARPTMLDLKESGDIEAHAYVVLLLYMPVDKKDELTGEDEIIIGKNRNGKLGAEAVVFDKRRLQFLPRLPGVPAQ